LVANKGTYRKLF